MKVIDLQLLKVKPPNEVRRNPRSLSEKAYWKATEWRAFLLLYSPVVLRGVLSGKFYRHWMLLVNAISILLSSSVTNEQINFSEKCL